MCTSPTSTPTHPQGACVLPQVPKQAPRVHRGLVERGQLGNRQHLLQGRCIECQAVIAVCVACWCCVLLQEEADICGANSNNNKNSVFAGMCMCITTSKRLAIKSVSVSQMVSKKHTPSKTHQDDTLSTEKVSQALSVSHCPKKTLCVSVVTAATCATQPFQRRVRCKTSVPPCPPRCAPTRNTAHLAHGRYAHH